MFWHWRKHPRDGECLTVFVLFCIHSPDCWINQPGHCLCFALRTPLIFQSSPISDIGGADSSSSLKTPAVQGCETSTHAHRAVNKALQTDSYMQASLYNCGVCRHLHQYCIAFILHDLSNAHTLFSLKEFTTLKLRHLNTVRGKKTWRLWAPRWADITLCRLKGVDMLLAVPPFISYSSSTILPPLLCVTHAPHFPAVFPSTHMEKKQ